MNKRREIKELALKIYHDSKQIVAYSEGILNMEQVIVFDFIKDNGLWESLYLLSANHSDVPEEVQDVMDNLEDSEFVEVLEAYIEYKKES